MTIKYTKKGLEVTHPTGVVRIHTLENLKRNKTALEDLKSNNASSITEINGRINELQAIVKTQ